MNNSSSVHEDISTYLKCGHFFHWYGEYKSTEISPIHSHLNKHTELYSLHLQYDDLLISVFQPSHLICSRSNNHNDIKAFSFSKQRLLC